MVNLDKAYCGSVTCKIAHKCSMNYYNYPELSKEERVSFILITEAQQKDCEYYEPL